ncbi:uncharacterized protein LOC119743619 isoform X1 [Patiria miniata]|uniref:Fibronectin type-III domain-containing protein n=1 Tax=Patiria miniata TaxID=46514 RepID=A0A914BKH0_PATMI|nr:uncharacterized protein LOC119743619 isoform X1 [Patiria miniata]
MWLTMASVFRLISRQGTRLFPITPMQIVGIVLCLVSMVEGGVPAAPRNLTLVLPLLSREVKIRWLPGNPRDNLTDYVIVNRAEGSDTKTVSRIDPEYNSFTLKDLKEETAYLVYVKAAIGNVRSLSSATLEFTTPRTEGLHRTFTTSGADLVIVVMVMALWLAALSLFIRTWKKKMSSTGAPVTSSGGHMRMRSRYRKPWMWSQKYRPGRARAYPTT